MSEWIIYAILLIIANVTSIWPPAYKVNLTHEETFVISEVFGSDNDDNIYDQEDEMIKEKQLEPFKLAKDTDKYYRLHQLSVLENQKKGSHHRYRNINLVKTKPREINFDAIDSIPWTGGFVDKDGNYTDNKNVYYFNEMAKKMVEDKINEKRENEDVIDENADYKNYDYAGFKAEYENQVRVAKTSNETLNYIDVKEEESMNEAIAAIANFKKFPKNCTTEEMNGIAKGRSPISDKTCLHYKFHPQQTLLLVQLVGLGAGECFWADLKKPHTKEERLSILRKIRKTLTIWFLIYIVIAIPCWCQRGWCCCWFQCRVCKPRMTIDEAKKFMMDNPIGVYHNEKNKKIMYEPTSYEKHTQKKLERALMKL